jgi:hypothetical protein
MTDILIPKLFHWIWFGPKALPEQYRCWIEGWLDLHPGWEHVLWTDANRPTLVNEVQFQGADSFAQKADIARYEIVHRYGGVYLDTDTECLRCIEPLLAGVEAFVVEGEPHTVEASPVGATQGHPWLAEVIARLPHSMEVGWGNMHQAGPRFLTSVTLGRRDVVIFEERLFTSEPADQSTRIDEAKRAQAYSIHHWGNTWGIASRSRYEAKLNELVIKDIEPVVPPESIFILVNKGETLKTGGDRRSIPFPERDGEWSGYPADDAAAIAELQRLRLEGAEFIVFPTYMSYWLETYPGLRQLLLAEGRCVVNNSRALIFDLRQMTTRLPSERSER